MGYFRPTPCFLPILFTYYHYYSIYKPNLQLYTAPKQPGEPVLAPEPGPAKCIDLSHMTCPANWPKYKAAVSDLFPITTNNNQKLGPLLGSTTFILSIRYAIIG